jgi:hypothetical protein
MTTMTPEQMRREVAERLPEVVEHLNQALRGDGIEQFQEVLTRLGRGQEIPHWYGQLAANGTLPNLDGKTIGSIVEMLLAAVLEQHIFVGQLIRVNPARGVDFPDLGLSVKAPSENYCTSEPFFSAYERLIGGESSALVLLTNYQSQKKRPPLKLQVLNSRFLEKTQIADKGLCRLALRLREGLATDQEPHLTRVIRFLAFVNQSDWRAKQLLRLFAVWPDDDAVAEVAARSPGEFAAYNKGRVKKGMEPLPDADLRAILTAAKVQPSLIGLVDAADNWVAEVTKDFGRLPNDNEWQRFLSSPLDGMIGMSFALQWRYNFQKAFDANAPEDSLISEDPQC